MSTKVEIKCIERYLEFIGDKLLMSQFLIDEKLVDNSFFIKNDSVFVLATKLQRVLSDLLKADKILLVYYEWNLLPKEQLKITITTSQTHKEFYFGY